MDDDWISMKTKGGAVGLLGGVFLGKLASHLVGVAFDVDIHNGVEQVTELALGSGLSIGGMEAGAELDWRRKVALEKRERDAAPELDGAVPLPPGR